MTTELDAFGPGLPLEPERPLPPLLTRVGLVPGDLRGRRALITGGARGIGAATAEALAALGAQLVVFDRLPVDELAGRVTEAGGHLRGVNVDLADPEATLAATTRVLAEEGEFDLFVHSPAFVGLGPVTHLALADWRRSFTTNLDSAFVITQALLPRMLAAGRGAITYLLSAEGTPLNSGYGASKAALRSLLQSLSAELGPQSPVHIFGFAPGVVDTPLVRELVPRLAAMVGAPVEAILTQIAQNPGYPGLVPVEHVGAALAAHLVHAHELHGQVADSFSVLRRFGVAPLPAAPLAPAPPSVVMPEAESDRVVAQMMSELRTVTDTNQNLELRIERRTQELAQERARSEALLHALLPQPIVPRLREGEVIADLLPEASVLFADMRGFTPLAARLSPRVLLTTLTQLFGAFDALADEHHVEKIKTIGDCYMAATGLFAGRERPVDDLLRFALAIQRALAAVPYPEEGGRWALRVGVHTGPAVAGVIGNRRTLYDLWGDTVNIASRMESHGLPDRVQVTDAVKAAASPSFQWEERPGVVVKGLGEMRTWLLVG
ncbi:SDR family NAD(P)-dependent oxidoreductase [Myxococcota bacterium]|nr:SDR family NAD(P)-dependent oxidoreductase [Myxococcota bacterium]